MTNEWNWDDIPESNQSDYRQVEDGNYDATLEKAEKKTTKNGDDYLSIWWRLNGGDFDNKIVFMNCYCHTDKTKNKFKGTMSNLGLKEKLASCKSTDTVLTMAEMILNNQTTMAEIAVKQNGDFTNVYVNKLLTEVEKPVVNHAPTFNTKEELPF